MATAYTSLLGLALPVTGELSGSWGDIVNDSITSLLDSAISGTTSLTTDADVTLTTTTGAANQARQAIILWNPASGSTTRNITAPAQSKIYTVINASGGTQSIVFRGAGPTTGVTIIKGESAVVAWNGTDFIKISNTGGGGSFTNVTISGTTTLSGLTASTALALNASKEVVSVTNTGTGNNVLATSPTLVTPALGTPSSATLTNATGLPISTGVSGLGTGIATALAVNVGTAGAPVINGGALGTPSSGTVTNLTGTASININGTVGATTPTTGAFTTLTTSSTVTLNGGTANGVAYLDGSKVLTTGSALVFDSSDRLIVGAASAAVGNRIEVVPTGAGGAIAVRGRSADALGYISWNANAASTEYARITSDNTSSLYFGLGASGSEQMRLTSTGLGIGTSSPYVKLQVTGTIKVATGNAQGILSLGDGNGATTNVGLWRGAANAPTTDGNFLNLGGYEGMVFAVGAAAIGSQTERMRLDSSGRLGLGVTPTGSYSMQIYGIGSASSGSARIRLQNSSTGSADADGGGIAMEGVDLVIQNSENGVCKWEINGSERARIDSSGNLLVGTTTVSNGNSVDSRVSIGNASDSAMLYLKGKDSTKSSVVAVEGPGQWAAYMAANGSASSGWSGIPSGAFGLTVAAPIPMVFATDSTERARIDSSGNLLVGTTSSTLGAADGVVIGPIESAWTVSNSGNVPIRIYNKGSSGTRFLMEFRNASSAVGTITHDGTNTAYNTSSDYRLKNITGPITTSGAYIDSLNPVEGTWKADGSTFVGLIAHEVQEASRTTVATGVKDGEEMQGMDYSNAELIANLIAEVKSLRQRLAAAGI